MLVDQDLFKTGRLTLLIRFYFPELEEQYRHFYIFGMKNFEYSEKSEKTPEIDKSNFDMAVKKLYKALENRVKEI